MNRRRKALNKLNEQLDHSRRGKNGNHAMQKPDKSAPASKHVAGVDPRIMNFGHVVFTGSTYLAPHGPRFTEADLPHRRTSEAVVGWRAWRLGKDADGEPVLVSAVMDKEWPGPVFRADNKPGVNDMHGVHAFRRTWMNTEYNDVGVEGEVLLFGKVIVFERGIRAESAMVRRLTIYPGGWAAIEDKNIFAGLWMYMDQSGFLQYKPAPTREFYTPEAEKRAGVAENRALVESLAKRYDCEVSFMERVTPESLAPEPEPYKPAAPTVHTPTEQEINRYGSR